MKPFLTVGLLLVVMVLLAAARPPQVRSLRVPAENGTPELHKIMHMTLSPSYSCRGGSDFAAGYAETALFLTEKSRARNAPELLFNGACGSADYFEGATAGDDLDVFTDYGTIPLSNLVAQQVFSPQRIVGTDAKFTKDVNVVAGHTYGGLINKSEVRGFFYFQVVAYVPNQKVEIDYVVQDYQRLQVTAQSPGFSWDAPSHN